MPSGIIAYKRQRGHQIPGIWATHKLLTEETRELISPLLPVTIPLIRAFRWVAENHDIGNKKLDFQEIYEFDPVIGCGVLALTEPRPRTTSPMYNDEPLLDEFGSPSEGVADAFAPLIADEFFTTLPVNLINARTMEHILIDGSMHWQVFVVLHDAVRNNKYAQYGGLKKWVFNSLLSYGFGHFAYKRSGLVTGRPPKLFVPNQWGERFSQIVQQNSTVEITDDMRACARITSSLPNPAKKLNQLKAVIDGFTSKGLDPPTKVVEKYQQLKDWAEDD
jgi:hypothetical protein